MALAMTSHPSLSHPHPYAEAPNADPLELLYAAASVAPLTTFAPAPLPQTSQLGTAATSVAAVHPAPSPLPSEYRRRRVIAALLLVTALYVLWGLASLVGGWLVGTAEASDAAPAPTTWVVESGDTMWSVAQSLDLSQDLRLTVDRLADANGGTMLQPGQVLDLSTARR